MCFDCCVWIFKFFYKNGFLLFIFLKIQTKQQNTTMKWTIKQTTRSKYRGLALECDPQTKKKKNRNINNKNYLKNICPRTYIYIWLFLYLQLIQNYKICCGTINFSVVVKKKCWWKLKKYRYWKDSPNYLHEIFNGEKWRVPLGPLIGPAGQIGRASCRERV